MRKRLAASLALTLIFAFAAPTALPQNTQSSAAGDDSVVYEPPLRGSPTKRVGGGTRGTEGGTTVVVLAPDHTTLTAQPRPTLYWSLSGTAAKRVDLTLTEEKAEKPTLERRIEGPVAPGVHKLSLAEYGVALKANVAYRWTVTVVTGAESSTRDPRSTGRVKFVPLSGDLQSATSSLPEGRRAATFARSGYWYDAIADLSQSLEQRPGDPTAKRQRTALLDQIGVSGVD